MFPHRWCCMYDLGGWQGRVWHGPSDCALFSTVHPAILTSVVRSGQMANRVPTMLVYSRKTTNWLTGRQLSNRLRRMNLEFWILVLLILKMWNKKGFKKTHSKEGLTKQNIFFFFCSYRVQRLLQKMK